MNGGDSAAPVVDPYAGHDPAAVAARWNPRAADWDSALRDPACHLNEGRAYDLFVRLVRRLVFRRRACCAQQGLIDAGCGTGLVLGELAPAFAWAVGVDLSPAMITQARAKNLPHSRWLTGDCFALPALCPPAGLVVSRGVLLSHYGAARGAELLAAWRAALVPGGWVACDYLQASGRPTARHAPDTKTWFTHESVTCLARDAGFLPPTTLGRPTRRVACLLAQNP